MPAYVIYEAEVVDAVGYEAYKTAAAASIAAAGGRYIVRGGAVEALEVDAPVGRTIVLEFPSMQVALDWYHSAEYTEVRKLRDGVAHARLFIVDGVDTPHSGDMRGARFEAVDLTGARFRDANLHDIKIADSFLAGANLSGNIAGLRINEVHVAPLVEAELDRRHPERMLMRNITNADGMRAAWTVLEERWAATVERARGLPEPALHERVDEEWSFVETLRHLVFATDAWVGRPILGETRPYHPMGLPPTGFDDPSWMGVDLTVTPTFDEALVVRRERTDTVRRIIEELTQVELDRTCAPNSAPGFPPQTSFPVGFALGIVVGEEWAHHQYAARDLTVLEARSR